MDKEQIRRNNFAALRETMSLGDIAEKTGINPTYLTRIDKGYRGFTEKKARELEAGLGLPDLWMDIDRSKADANPSLAELYEDLDSVDPEHYKAVQVLLGGLKKNE